MPEVKEYKVETGILSNINDLKGDISRFIAIQDGDYILELTLVPSR